MIYNSTITAVNESDILSLLENAEDRFEYYTMAEASAIIVGEQEANWTRFMKGIGMSEFSTVLEGEQVIYEGARLKSFITKAKAYFQMALNKLAEITKSFIAKVDQFFKSNDSFVKKYEKDLKKMSVPADFEFKGYTFKNMGVPEYKTPEKVTINASNASSYADMNKEKYSKEHAEDLLAPGASGETFGDKLINYFYGSKEKEKLGSINIGEQVDILKSTKDLKKNAKDSYVKAAKEIKSFIKELEKGEREALKTPEEGQSLAQGQKIDQAYSTLISFWKAYANGAQQKHATYMRALGTRNRQAKAICTKLIVASGKAAGKEKRAEMKPKTEGFVNTEDFLGAVEFI